MFSRSDITILLVCAFMVSLLGCGYLICEVAEAQQIQDGFYNVKDYGAQGDNMTDDTAAIQQAIDTARSDGGGIVFFPTGTYMTTDVLKVYNDIILRGAGRDITIIRRSNAGTVLQSDDPTTTRADITLEHIQIKCRDIEDDTTILLDCRGWIRGRLSNVIVKSRNQKGVCIGMARGCFHILLDHVRTEQAHIGYRLYEEGVDIRKPNGAMLINCTGIYNDIDFSIESGNNLTLIGAKGETYYEKSIHISGAGRTTIISPRCESKEKPDYDIHVRENSARVFIFNPHITSNSVNGASYGNAHLWTDNGIQSVYSLSDEFFDPYRNPTKLQNLLPNGNFDGWDEDGDAPIAWNTANLGVTRLTGDADYISAYGAKAENKTGADEDMYVEIDKSISRYMSHMASQDGRVWFTARLRCKTTQADLVRIRVCANGSGGVDWSDYSAYHTGGGDWEVLEVQSHFDDASKMDKNIRFYIHFSNNTTPVHLDYAYLSLGQLKMPMVITNALSIGGAITGDIRVDSDGHFQHKLFTASPTPADLSVGEVAIGHGTGDNGQDELFFKTDTGKVLTLQSEMEVSIPIYVTANATIYFGIMAVDRDITVTGLSVAFVNRPDSPTGDVTLAVMNHDVSAGADDNLLNIATFDLESLTSRATVNLPLTGAPADLDLENGDLVFAIVVSSRPQLMDGKDGIMTMKYRVPVITP